MERTETGPVILSHWPGPAGHTGPDAMGALYTVFLSSFPAGMLLGLVLAWVFVAPDDAPVP